MEYAIHGKYKRNSDDHNGVFGCWFIPLKELVKTFTKRSLNDALREFEEEAIEARKEAIDILYSQEEEEDESDIDSDSEEAEPEGDGEQAEAAAEGVAVESTQE
jgi:hypothetical protein